MLKIIKKMFKIKVYNRKKDKKRVKKGKNVWLNFGEIDF
jgi:hypothetical protein